ncbi:ATPase family associated with various cellular activities (AAA) [Chitinophaga jiangningensis]|uniref:ATPase family associated with various cellular activities (AAA) n=1 Tax=Chitinophaga jiangningensis TaxID=1419482 RepID=A0A1M7ECH6_9BACT|nr:ATP-binding protein [Chitinophaga jiangningensis]SHL89328.1 ATPase family associated with various cellular activities (AAA) [Chitinophaga jiangningensis]
MSQLNYIKDIAKFGLENDQERLLSVLNELIEHSKKTKKINFALQLQSILKDAIRVQKTSSLTKAGSDTYFNRLDDKETGELILEKLTSDYTFENLVADLEVKEQLSFFIKEHQAADILREYGLPIANKILFHGPSGCGKTLASYVIAGELHKMMVVVNLGAIVSSKLGETSKNLAKIFRKAASEDCIIFIDEFDTLGKVRDYDQDHGEMKRVVNTILQLFDYLPQTSIVIAATNQKEMLDDAILRRFDVNIRLDLPNENQIIDLVNLTLRNGQFKFASKASIKSIIKDAIGLSYYSIQKTLITAIKRSIFSNMAAKVASPPTIDLRVWRELIAAEKKALKS